MPNLLRRSNRAAALAAFVLLAAAACSTPQGEPGPAQSAVAETPSSSTSTSVTKPSTNLSSTSPDVSGVPEAARANTGDGAIAFVRFFLDQANAAYRSSDSGLYQDLVLPTCKTCASMTSTLDGYRSKQYRYVGDFVSPISIDLNSFDDSGVSVRVATDTGVSKVFASNGSLVEEVPAAKGTVAVQLERDGDQWRVSGIKGA
jgi:Family of unknown function (DUF6318)